MRMLERTRMRARVHRAHTASRNLDAVSRVRLRPVNTCAHTRALEKPHQGFSSACARGEYLRAYACARETASRFLEAVCAR